MSEDSKRWNRLCSEAKSLRHEGCLEEALNKYRQALQITPNHEKLIGIISKIESHLASKMESMVHLGEGFYLSKSIYEHLYDYQKDGVLFLYKLFLKRRGGILGDDMGLGKTVQVCSFLSGMFDLKKITNAIIVVPPPLISNWETELLKWTPGLNIVKFHECTKREKEKLVKSISRDGGVFLTTYNMYTTSSELLGEVDWDYSILDEGHKIKNHQTKTAKSLHTINCPHRLILTGTPIMNNLKELWALYDWAHQGQLLGNSKTFSEKFENPITRARQKDASPSEKNLGEAMAEQLNKLISPFMLRRLKNSIKMISNSNEQGLPEFTKKNDLICWIRLSEDQEKVYRAFLTSPEVKQLLNLTRSPLVALTMLKKICDHPRLLTNKKCKMLGVSEGETGLNEDSDDEDRVDISSIPTTILVKEAGKMRFLFGLLDELRESNHKCLLFSQSRKILDIVEKILGEKEIRFCRLDGRVKKMAERQEIINKFQRSNKYKIFLLTTKVGGVGLTLTAASRVIIYDPSWNPSTDAQAVDRAFRIGQKKDVVIYRLITCGTVEEKIYRRQVYKDSISKKILQDKKNPVRHFSKQDLFQLFELDNLEESETQKQLAEMFRGTRNSDEHLESHIQFLHSLDHFTGVSDHDLMFSKEADDDDAEDCFVPESNQFLEGYVSQAMERLNLESEENKVLSQQIGRYVGGGILESKHGTAKKQKSPEREAPIKKGSKSKSPQRRKFAFMSSDEENPNSAEGKDDDGNQFQDKSSDDGNALDNGNDSDDDGDQFQDKSSDDGNASNNGNDSDNDYYVKAHQNPLKEMSHSTRYKNVIPSTDEELPQNSDAEPERETKEMEGPRTPKMKLKRSDSQSSYGEDVEQSIVIVDETFGSPLPDERNSVVVPDTDEEEDKDDILEIKGDAEEGKDEDGIMESRDEDGIDEDGDRDSIEDDYDRKDSFIDDSYNDEYEESDDDDNNYNKKRHRPVVDDLENSKAEQSHAKEASFSRLSTSTRSEDISDERSQNSSRGDRSLEDSEDEEGDANKTGDGEEETKQASESISTDDSREDTSMLLDTSKEVRDVSMQHDVSGASIDDSQNVEKCVNDLSLVNAKDATIAEPSLVFGLANIANSFEGISSEASYLTDRNEMMLDEENGGEKSESEKEESHEVKYQELLESGRNLCNQQQFEEGLEKFKLAYGMYDEGGQDPVIKKMIVILEEKIAARNMES